MSRELDFERTIVERHGSLLRYVQTILGGRAEAEDVVQEAMLRAWRSLPAWRGEAPIEAWLMRICRNAALDELRRRARRGAPGSLSGEDVVVEVGFARVDAADLLAGLALEHREVLVLVEVLGWDYRSVADVLDVPVGTVRSRLSRARSAVALLADRARAAESA